MAILHIYGDRGIFLPFYDNQDTESQSLEIGLVKLDQYSSRKTLKVLWENNIHTQQDGRKIFWQIFKFMELEPFHCYFVITNTLNLSHLK